MKRIGIVLVVALVFTGCRGQSSTSNSGPTTAASVAAPSIAATPSVAPATPSVAPATPSVAPATPSVGSGDPTLTQLIGQKLVVRMDGHTPSASLLGRIKRGEVGGVVLFGSNITTRTALIALTGKLRAAAAAGGQPALLIAVDQEGGPIKRIPWAPPTLSPPQMGQIGLASTARSQGAATAAALKALGINVDFAPVADVPASAASFMYQEGRTFSFSATHTALLADAFASGLESKGVVPTMKHFPGLGFATRNTDDYVVTISASRAALAPGLLPYRTAIAHHIPMIMLSNATYTAWDTYHAAGWSAAISVSLLRHSLGFSGVTITDSLDGTAHARGLTASLLAYRAAYAGTDMLLLTGSEETTRAIFARLVLNAQQGAIPATTLQASYDRIIALKADL